MPARRDDMNEMRVRIYNVRFGDAILVSVPDRAGDGEEVMRHIVIDIGNAYGGEGGRDHVFLPVIENIREELGGNPADLYIMTHEHMDHVQGLLYSSREGVSFGVDHVWMTASANPNYGEFYPETRKRNELWRMEVDETYRQLATEPALNFGAVKTLFDINNPRRTDDCVQHIRDLSPRCAYLYRDVDLTGSHPFSEVSFDIWGPEEDASVYYGRFKPMCMSQPGTEDFDDALVNAPAIHPPPGVDTGAFYDLVSSRRLGFLDNLLAIDKANNNTSLVFSLTWRGWKLLFTGDAERKSWQFMDKFNKVSPVHFLKVSHHGSRTGLPNKETLDRLLPDHPPDAKPRHAVVSTCFDTYSGVPDEELLNSQLGVRCQLAWTSEDALGDSDYIDYTFTGGSDNCTVVRKSISP